jgi:prepilin-type N-terminal cleavage/methylation domain-containing protein
LGKQLVTTPYDIRKPLHRYFIKMDGGFVYKITIVRLNRSINNHKGLTLVELLAVIIIVGIIATIAVPNVIHLIKKSKEDVCLANRTELQRQYELKLEFESIEHTEQVFLEYLLENNDYICPSGGEIGYEDGVVNCSIHSQTDEDPEDETEEMPYL